MTFILYVLLALVLLCAVLFLILRYQIRAKKKAEAEVSRLTGSYQQLVQKLKALEEAQKKNAKITEEANDKRRELNNTTDDELICRANRLFGGGVQDNADTETNADGN